MSLDVDDIVHPPRDPVVAVLVPVSPVPGEVHPRVRPVVRVQELLVVAVDGSSHGRPGSAEAQVPRHAIALDFLALRGKRQAQIMGQRNQAVGKRNRPPYSL